MFFNNIRTNIKLLFIYNNIFYTSFIIIIDTLLIKKMKTMTFKKIKYVFCDDVMSIIMCARQNKENKKWKISEGKSIKFDKVFLKKDYLDNIPELNGEYVIVDDKGIMNVAFNKNSIIMIRPPGFTAGMLLAQGYDGKSFHLKAKSCNWGPMMGFVCLDPRMNKLQEKGEKENLKFMQKSFKNPYDGGALPEAIQIVITDKHKRAVDQILRKDASHWTIEKLQNRDAGVHNMTLYKYHKPGRADKPIVSFVLVYDRTSKAINGATNVHYMYKTCIIYACT